MDATSKSGQIRALLTTGMTVADIAKKIGCSANLVYIVKVRTEKPAKLRGPFAQGCIRHSQPIVNTNESLNATIGAAHPPTPPSSTA